MQQLKCTTSPPIIGNQDKKGGVQLSSWFLAWLSRTIGAKIHLCAAHQVAGYHTWRINIWRQNSSSAEAVLALAACSCTCRLSGDICMNICPSVSWATGYFYALTHLVVFTWSLHFVSRTFLGQKNIKGLSVNFQACVNIRRRKHLDIVCL